MAFNRAISVPTLMQIATQSEHIELTLLGAALLDAVAASDAVAKLEPRDFFLGSHQTIFRAIASLQERGLHVDTETVRLELEKKGEFTAVGGYGYLLQLTDGIPRNFNVESYAIQVKERSRMRQLAAIFHEGGIRANDATEDSVGLLSDVEELLADVSDGTIQSGLAAIPEIVKDSGGIDKIFMQAGEVTGLATGFTDFDRMTSGLQESELIIIAARPSMGKTAWAINIAENIAIPTEKVVAVYSLEMSKAALLKRLLASQSSVSSRRLQAGFIASDERRRLHAGLEQLMGSKLFIDDTPGITLAEMRAKARRLKQQEKRLDLILVDYLQLMTAPKKENRTQEVSAISKGLKALAKEMKCPVVALSQLSRNSEQRAGNKKPLLSDLRESGSIEQDADVVAFIHRDEYYDRDDEDLKGKAEIIVAKQRNGPTGSINLTWLADLTRFENAAQE